MGLLAQFSTVRRGTPFSAILEFGDDSGRSGHLLEPLLHARIIKNKGTNSLVLTVTLLDCLRVPVRMSRAPSARELAPEPSLMRRERVQKLF